MSVDVLLCMRLYLNNGVSICIFDYKTCISVIYFTYVGAYIEGYISVCI